MKIIKAGYQKITEPSITKKIERIARVCYKSEDKIAEGTDLKMIGNLIKRQHYAMLEHGSFALDLSEELYEVLYVSTSMKESAIVADDDLRRTFLRFTQVKSGEDVRYIVSGNIRAWLESLDDISVMTYGGETRSLPQDLVNAICVAAPGIFDNRYTGDEMAGTYQCDVITDFSYLTRQERMMHEDITVLFTVDRGVTHELVRMRDCSFAQESTRYCNYNLDKHDKQITVIEPCFYTADGREDEYNAWVSAMEDAEKYYLGLTANGSTPQEARAALPTSVKADIVMTTNLYEWKHIFNLRACDSTGPAHPQMKEVMIPFFKDMRQEYPFAFGDMIAADEVH